MLCGFLLVSLATASDVIERYCATLLQLGAHTWWRRYLACEKYSAASGARGWDAALRAWQLSPVGGGRNGWGAVGEYSSLTCAAKDEDVFAWERNTGWAGERSLPLGANGEPVAYYGCLNKVSSLVGHHIAVCYSTLQYDGCLGKVSSRRARGGACGGAS